MNLPSPREELEIRITALLMGELPSDEAAALQSQIAADAELTALHTRLQRAAGLLREASALPSEAEPHAPPVPARLSDDRRARLLAHFQGAKLGPVIVKPRRDWRRNLRWAVPLGLAASLMALIGGAMYVNGFGLRKGSVSTNTTDLFESDSDEASAGAPAEKRRADARFAMRGVNSDVIDSSAAWGSQPGMIRIDSTKEGRRSGKTDHYFRSSGPADESRDATGTSATAHVASGSGAVYLPSASDDLFKMKVAEPFAISESLSTDGKIALNRTAAPASSPQPAAGSGGSAATEKAAAATDPAFFAGTNWDTPRVQTFFDRDANGDGKESSFKGGLSISNSAGNRPELKPTDTIGRGAVGTGAVYLPPAADASAPIAASGKSADGQKKYPVGDPSLAVASPGLLAWTDKIEGSVVPLAGDKLPEPRITNGKSDLSFAVAPTPAPPAISPSDVDGSRYFLTPHTRSPELNLFGRPRVSNWPSGSETVQLPPVTGTPGANLGSLSAGGAIVSSSTDERGDVDLKTLNSLLTQQAQGLPEKAFGEISHAAGGLAVGNANKGTLVLNPTGGTSNAPVITNNATAGAVIASNSPAITFGVGSAALEQKGGKPVTADRLELEGVELSKSPVATFSGVISGLDGTKTVTLDLNGQTALLGDVAASNAAGVSKSGNGTLALSTTNNFGYTGATTVTGGTSIDRAKESTLPPLSAAEQLDEKSAAKRAPDAFASYKTSGGEGRLAKQESRPELKKITDAEAPPAGPATVSPAKPSTTSLGLVLGNLRNRVQEMPSHDGPASGESLRERRAEVFDYVQDLTLAAETEGRQTVDAKKKAAVALGTVANNSKTSAPAAEVNDRTGLRADFGTDKLAAAAPVTPTTPAASTYAKEMKSESERGKLRLDAEPPVPTEPTGQPGSEGDKVRWLGVTRSGALVSDPSAKGGETRANDPVVGKIAFWTDDDTTKVNINTAGGFTQPDARTNASVPRGVGQRQEQPPIFTDLNQPVGRPAGSSELTTNGDVVADHGAIALTKNGGGTWQMNGTNTYTGGTTLNGGTLALDAGRTARKPAAGWEETDFQAGMTFNYPKLSLHDGYARDFDTGIGRVPDGTFGGRADSGVKNPSDDSIRFASTVDNVPRRDAAIADGNGRRGEFIFDRADASAEKPKSNLPTELAVPEIPNLNFNGGVNMSGKPQGGVEASAHRELARRLSREGAAKEETAAGAEALRKKDYEAAFAHYKNASDNVPADAPAVASSRQSAVEGLTKSAVKLAEHRASEGHYASAVQTLQEALKQDPNSTEAQRKLREIEAPDYSNRQTTPQHQAKVEEVKQLFIEADGYKNLGRYDLADRKFQEIITRDPYNRAARKGREEVADLKLRSAKQGYDTTRAIATWEVDKDWDRPAKRKDQKAGEGKNDQKKNAAQEAVPGFGTNDAPKPAAPKKGNDATQQKFVEAFLKVKKGEELEKALDLKNAQATYREVAAKLEQIKKEAPQWQSELVDFRLKRTTEAAQRVEQQLAVAAAEEAKMAEAKRAEEEKAAAEKAAADKAAAEKAAKEKETEQSAPKPAPNPLVPQPEVRTGENAFSTFSLNVSDVAFKLAAASLERGTMPDVSTLRTEEFINAFDYRDPEPAPGAPLAFVAERARYPFAQNRDVIRFSVKTAAAGRQPGKPLNVVLLLDNSGSMERADRVRIVREGMRTLSAQLTPQDKLSIVTFARTPHLRVDGVAGDKAGEATARVAEITPEGGTNLAAALDLGYATALKHYQPGSINHVVLLTDGAANLGDVDPAALKQKVEAHRKQGIALDCFGVGWEGLNDDMLEQLSRNGDGRYGFINTPEEAATNFAGQLAGALRVAASDVKVQVEWNPKRVTAYRQVGYAKHQLTKEQFRDNTVDAAELAAAESGNALYVVEVNPRGEGDLATVRVRFKVPGTSDYREHEWTVPFTRAAAPLDQSSSSLRLAASAAAFSEMLAGSPFATEVTSERLLALVNGLPAIYGADQRPQKLEWMIRQAKSLSGR